MTAALSRRARPARRRAICATVAVLVVALLAACTGSSGHSERPLPKGPYSTRPNIVFVLTDDLSDNLVQYMPHVIALEQEGMRFTNYTVTDSLCCPSRASIFTGEFPHNTHVFTNGSPDGGFAIFQKYHKANQTFAIPLHAAGYRTAFLGKYLNGLKIPSGVRPDQTADAHYIPPGWSYWAGAGYAYNEFDYDLNENGTLHHYGSAPQDYLTDVIGKLGQGFITDSARARKPFFMELATFSPHSPSTPAPQDAHSFHLRAPRGPSFGKRPLHAPAWMNQLHKRFTAGEIRSMNEHFTRRVESMQSVDRMIGNLENTLKRSHQLSNTVFVFSSDNGYHLGEHGMLGGKLTAFDTDVKVPLVVVGPGIDRNSVNSDVVENVDLAPTFEELAGATTPATVDGHSFVSLLHGEQPSWRTLATIEHHGPDVEPGDPDRQTVAEGNPPTYDAIRSATYTYVRYLDGEREYYDRVTDPYEMDNTYDTLSKARIAYLNKALDKLVVCRGEAQCWSAARPTVG